MLRFDHGDMSRLDRRLLRSLLFEYLIERIAVIVIAEREMSIDARFLKWSNQFCKMPIVTRLAILESQVTIDQHARWLSWSIYQFGNNLAQMSGDR